MENLLCKGVPVPIANIKDFDDSIVEGINTTITNKEIVNDWDTKNHKKITNNLSVCQNEKIFEDVLNDYIRVLKEQALNFIEKSVLKARILRHIKVFHMYYSTNDGIRTDMCNYLDQMEKILIVLCNLELEVVRHVKRKEKDYSRKIKEVAQSLISILSIFMLHRERSILHVLLKLDSRHDTSSWKDVMHIVYRYYLITLPVDDRSDECFCRNYLLFQRWKSITDERKHMGMDKIMYFRFSRSPESIARSRTLRTILSPSAESTVGVVDVLTDGRQTAVDAYFKHVEQKDKEDEMCLPPSINLYSDEEDKTQTLQFRSQPTDAHDGAAESYEIPMDVIADDYSVTADNEISNGILNKEKSDKSDYQPYVTDGDIMLVHNVNKSDGMYNKFSLFKKVSDLDEAIKSTLQNDQHSDANRKASLLSGASIKRLVEDLPVGEAKKVSFPDSYKIQASIQMSRLVNKSSLKKDKLNGENNKIVHVAEKIIFTSNERVNCPLSPFAQFKQSQSELVEKALCGPIEPINSKRSVNSDNSNSNDSFYLFESNKSSSTQDHVRNSLLESPEGSLISPPYEDIHALKKHILIVNSGELVSKSKHAIEKEIAMDENRDNKMLQRRLNNTTSTDVQNTKIMSTRINKRRHNDEGKFPSKQPRVNFGPTEVRIIPPECQSQLSEHTIELARESIEDCKVAMNNKQLLYLQPQGEVERDSPEDLVQKEKHMKMQHAIVAHKLNNTINELFTSRKNELERTCIVKRVDYKNKVDDGISPNTFSKLPENSNGSNSLHSVGLSVLNSRSKQVDTPSASSFSSPTSCASRAVTLFSSARELEDPSFVGKVEEAPNNSSQHHEESQSFSNDKFNELLDQDNAEILNLSDKLLDKKKPLKKRSVPVINVKSQIKTDEKLHAAKEEISYPATPMICIAELEALRQNCKNHNRSFKTPAERKEMPPLPVFYNLNTTDPNPINYHMSNVPVPFINVPCASYYSLPPILLPFNNIHTAESANVNHNPNSYNTDDGTASAAKVIKNKEKEKKKRSRKDKHSENYYHLYKKANFKTV